jgi:hypothetical protein
LNKPGTAGKLSNNDKNRVKCSKNNKRLDAVENYQEPLTGNFPQFMFQSRFKRSGLQPDRNHQPVLPQIPFAAMLNSCQCP